jgi:excisionase family DNA binding protein
MRSELLTVPQVADRLGCSDATVKRRIRDGALPTFRDGRLVRVRELDLDRYIAEHVTRTAAPRGSSPRTGVMLRPGERLWH